MVKDLFYDSIGQNKFWLINEDKEYIASRVEIVFSGDCGTATFAIYGKPIESDTPVTLSTGTGTGNECTIELVKTEGLLYIYGTVSLVNDVKIDKVHVCIKGIKEW